MTRRAAAVPGGSTRARLAAVTAAVAGIAAAGLVAAPPPGAHAAAAPPLAYTPVAGWWGTNGRVTDILPVGSKVFLSGGFDYIGPQSGYGTAVDAASGVAVPGAPIVDGVVRASAPDGDGGWYIGGTFQRVGGVARRNAAHLTAAGALDPDWNPRPNGSVYALAVSGSEVVLGGAFTTVGKTQVTADRIGAVDGSQGYAVPGFSASADNTVRALAVTGPSVFVGGDFTAVDGSGHLRVARIAAADGAADESFTGAANAPVRAFAVSGDGSTLYAGGDFTQAFGTSWQNRAHLAAWSTSGNALQPWAPQTDASVEALAVDASAGTVYAGGLFGSVNGQTRVRLAAIGASGATLPFAGHLNGCQIRHTTKDAHSNPACTPEVASLAVGGGALYVGGRFGNSGTTSRHDVASFDLATGQLTGWDPRASDRVLTLTPGAGTVFVGGEMTSINGLVRKGVAALDATTGAGVPGFKADTDDEVLDMAASPDGSTLYLAGHFRTVNGASRNHLAAVSTADGTVTRFVAQADNDVLSVVYAGTAVFAAGQFTTVNGITRRHAVKLNPATGAVDATFVASTSGPSGPLRANGMVQSMTATSDGARVFLAGPFDVVDGQSVAMGVVAVSGRTGALLAKLGGVERCTTLGPWIVHLYLSPDNARLYGGGVCPDRIYQWDAVNMTTTANPTGLDWKSWCNGGMQGALEVAGRFYYGSHGGDKGSGGVCWASPTDHTNVVRSRYAVFDAASGVLQPDAVSFNSPMGVWSFAWFAQGLLVGGDFSWAVTSSNVRQGLVRFDPAS